MLEMQDKIKKDLINRVDTAHLMNTIATGFYDRLVELDGLYPVFRQMLWEYESFTEYFEAANEELNADQIVLLKEMKLTIEDEIDDAFNAAEDHTMEELLESRWESVIRKDFSEQGITLYPGAPMSADQIEELYVDAFRAFDRYKEKLMAKVWSLSPQKAYLQGQKNAEDYRKKNGIVFDEEDFLSLYDNRLDKMRLMKLLAEKVEQVMKYSRHYKLEFLEEAEMDAEPEYEDEAEIRDSYDGVMSYDGDMRDQCYTFVSELMNEYTGRRVLATENEWSGESYWTTYGEDFQDLILMYVETELENQIRFMNQEMPETYEAFAEHCKMDEKQRLDPQELLLACDRINYGLAQRVEDLWSEFCEKSMDEILALAKEK